jgi:hypothetical protein
LNAPCAAVSHSSPGRFDYGVQNWVLFLTDINDSCCNHIVTDFTIIEDVHFLGAFSFCPTIGESRSFSIHHVASVSLV